MLGLCKKYIEIIFSTIIIVSILIMVDYYKDPHSYPNPEKLIDVNKRWAFTINVGGDELNHIKFERYMAVFQRMSVFCDIMLYPEFSKKMRLHYHGTFQLWDESKILPFYVLLNDIKRNFTFCIRDLSDTDKWEEYCTKQRDICRPYMHKQKLPYAIDNDQVTRKDIKYYLNVAEELEAGLTDSSENSTEG